MHDLADRHPHSDAAHEIQYAISLLLGAHEVVQSACAEIRAELAFDFVAIQLIEPLGQIIETVYGAQEGGEWYKLACHSLEVPDEFRDIQAHVAVTRPPVIEIAAERHPRFDPFIFEKFGHARYERAFVPLILGRNREGELSQAGVADFVAEFRGEGNRVIRLAPKDSRYEIIGTVEAGYDNGAARRKVPRHIENAQAEALFAASCKQARIIYPHTLWRVLQLIVRHVRRLTGTMSAAIVLPEAASFPYRVWSGFHPSEDPARSAKRFIAGDDPHSSGVLILEAPDQEASSAERIIADTNLKTFLDEAGDAIQHARLSLHSLHLMRQLENLHDIARALAYEPESSDLLETIAGHVQNVLAADVVAIYGARDGAFRKGDFGIVGLRSSGAFPDWTPPAELFREAEAGLVRRVDTPRGLAALYGPGAGKRGVEPFLDEEKIKAALVVPLRVSDDVVGIMLINFRRPIFLSKGDEKSVETVASTAAVAIRTKRLLAQREDDVQQLVHDLSGMLDSMVRTATELKRESDSMYGQAEVLRSISQTVRLSLREGVPTPDEEPEMLDVYGIIRRIWSVVKQNRSRSVELAYASEIQHGIRLRWYRSALAYVCFALLDNAAKYADEASTARIGCAWEADGRFRLDVTSTGLPIYPHERQRIFGKFQRGEAAREAKARKGVGLGLFIASRVMQAHGGVLDVNCEGNVSCFFVSIPAAVTEARHAEAVYPDRG